MREGERANQKKSCSRQSADRARITCRGCDDKESGQREEEGGAVDRDAKSFRDRDAAAFNGLYVICELGVGVAHQSQEIESVAVPVAHVAHVAAALVVIAVVAAAAATL